MVYDGQKVAAIGMLFSLVNVFCTSPDAPLGECYTPADCQFLRKDSSGLVSAEPAGECKWRSEMTKMCLCFDGFTGKNCEFKKCPQALQTDFYCNGVEGEGTDLYDPFNSEWNKYDQINSVEFAPKNEAAAVGGVCDFTTGRCK